MNYVFFSASRSGCLKDLTSERQENGTPLVQYETVKRTRIICFTVHHLYGFPVSLIFIILHMYFPVYSNPHETIH